MSRSPVVSVVVPAHNEERDIERCLAAILGQDYPGHLMELVVVIDAGSSDATETIARRWLRRTALRRTVVLRNDEHGTPQNLNAGLRCARGDVLCRVDARSRIPPWYVSRCVEVLTERPDVVVVGGSQVAIPPITGPVGTGIARALNNRWGTGLARYRRAATSGPSDTVYLGAFRTWQLRCAGGWDVRFGTNQDFELNRRLSQLGTVWFDASIPVEYVPRSTLRDLFRQYVRFGRSKVRYWRHTGDRPRPRQALLLAGAPCGAAAAAVVLVAATPRGRVGLLVGAAAVAFLLEGMGASRPAGGPLARLAALCALGTVAVGWLGGIAAEAVPARRSRPVR